jgi:hypothetical protein
MRFISLLALSLVALLVVAMGWQHFRYLNWRRSAAQDHQPTAQAFAHFDATYHHGMQRSAVLNLAMPMLFLGMRVVDILNGVSEIDPYDRASDEVLAARARATLPSRRPIAVTAARWSDSLPPMCTVLRTWGSP